ncbi:murein transglycosylase A [Commensalibacter oyaizuii]|uniref:peptidoglycan lytic exotransglycosylase n=1 Tax=Commensalibacter oyaizuii TaxID=3043873 RepID=A0ABT6Q0J9_9PROT|nr:murein transglycosylase A [Commensalibacter sp. TBRC 16381]MDI2090014.1 murein transglycosylase A [Commensalibacter sp. TBRC 16381]
MKSIARLLIITLTGGLTACAVQTPENPTEFYPVSYQNLSGWDQENYGQLLVLFQQNCQKMDRQPPNTRLGGASGLFGGVVQDWIPACQASMVVNPNNAVQSKQFFENWLQPYQYSVQAKTGKVTGYYEPEIEGSTVQGGAYQIPVYGKPPELIARKDGNGQIQYGIVQNGQFIPYYTRAQIDQGALRGRGLEVAWVKDPADLFFMQIQGSGRILLPNGQTMRLGYAGKNGQPYTALGKVLIDQGLMASNDVNMYTLRAWLHNHPDQAMSLMQENKNYVFFKPLNADVTAQAPVGAFGIPLTAGRSVAVDKNWVPLGAPLWLEISMPLPPNQERHPWKHMVFAHDLGGGITGINRIDLFTGYGRSAEWYAGLMNEKGKIFLLLPRRTINQQAVPAVQQNPMPNE